MVLSNLQCTIPFLLMLVTGSKNQSNAEVVVVSADTSNFIHSTVLLTCVGHGIPSANVTWERNGDFILTHDSEVEVNEERFTEDDFNFTLSTLVLCSVEFEDAGNYTCVVTNYETFAFDSLNVELTVIDNRAPPQVVAITSNTSAKLYSTLLLTCVGFGVPLPNIKWEVKFNGSNILNDSRVNNKVDICEYRIVEERNVFIQSVLVLCRIQYNDYSDYTCFVEGDNSSAVATTSVVLDPVEAQVIIGPMNTTAEILFDTVLFTCVGYAIPIATIKWEKSGNSISNDAEVTVYEEYLTVDDDYTFTKSILEVCSVNVSSQGDYTCIVESRSSSANLTSHLIVIDNIVAAQIVASTTQAIFTDTCTTPLLVCVGVGYPRSTIKWEKNGNTLMSLNDSEVLIHENYMTRGEYVFTQSILQLCSVQFDSIGNYSCVANNEVGTSSEIIQLIVISAHDPPEIINLTQSVTAEIGKTVVLTCVADGFPSPEIQWEKNDITISNDSTVTITEMQLENGGMVFTQSSVELSSLQLNDAGQYTCTAISDCFTTNSSTAIIVVVSPEILVVTENVTAAINTTVLLTCIAYGIPSPVIEWMFDGSSISNDSTRTSTMQQADYRGLSFTQSTLTVCSVQLNNAGQYACSASNIQASVNQTIEVAVLVNEDLCSLLLCDPNAECKQDSVISTNFTCTCKAPDYYGDGFNCSEIGFFEKHKTPILSAVGATAAVVLIALLGTLYGYIHVGKTLGCSIKALKSAKENGNESDLLIEGDDAKQTGKNKSKRKKNDPE